MHKVGSASLACLFLLLATTACQNAEAPGQGTSSTTETAGPQDIYQRHCANCHGGNLQGGFGPALKKVGAKYDKDEILQIIQKGKGNMPSQDYVSKQDQATLAQWLSEQK
ncbi:cytochrome C551 [Laceyella sacchari]|jgi:cytochrome c551/cytochrome c550|uniref:Cytochrome c551/cytochrome c550 n=1 Tax=Laceyella tengchongensis TaxID=574699 RepID=A0AA46AF78_9BACL|nr:cytochrome c [Laceyella tengchongensis]AUS08944.1 cytochrome C551 [Laceyella sacchari]SMP18153.1 cytochrome c551/cytochrome c550 [Laceyella tengchongensis]